MANKAPKGYQKESEHEAPFVGADGIKAHSIAGAYNKNVNPFAGIKHSESTASPAMHSGVASDGRQPASTNLLGLDLLKGASEGSDRTSPYGPSQAKKPSPKSGGKY